MTEQAQNNIFQKFLDIVGQIFIPVINVLCAAGLLKGILSISLMCHLLNEKSSTYIALSVLSDLFFYFLPIFLAFTSAKVFGVNRFTCVLLATFLVHPQLAALIGTDHPTIYGLPIAHTAYTATVLPIIFSVILMKYIEAFFIRILPEAVRDMMVPLFTLLIIIPICLVIVGPMGNAVATFVTYGYNFLITISPMIAMAILAALFPIFILFGISTALAPVIINNIAINGFDTILLSLGCSLFALAGMSLAIYLRSHGEMKTTSLGAMITAFLGVGEPAVFGVGIANKHAFALCMGSAAVGGAIVGFAQAKVNAFIIPNLITLVAFIGQPGYIATIIGCISAFIVSFITNYLFK